MSQNCDGKGAKHFVKAASLTVNNSLSSPVKLASPIVHTLRSGRSFQAPKKTLRDIRHFLSPLATSCEYPPANKPTNLTQHNPRLKAAEMNFNNNKRKQQASNVPIKLSSEDDDDVIYVKTEQSPTKQQPFCENDLPVLEPVTSASDKAVQSNAYGSPPKIARTKSKSLGAGFDSITFNSDDFCEKTRSPPATSISSKHPLVKADVDSRDIVSRSKLCDIPVRAKQMEDVIVIDSDDDWDDLPIFDDCLDTKNSQQRSPDAAKNEKKTTSSNLPDQQHDTIQICDSSPELTILTAKKSTARGKKATNKKQEAKSKSATPRAMSKKLDSDEEEDHDANKKPASKGRQNRPQSALPPLAVSTRLRERVAEQAASRASSSLETNFAVDPCDSSAQLRSRSVMSVLPQPKSTRGRKTMVKSTTPENDEAKPRKGRVAGRKSAKEPINVSKTPAVVLNLIKPEEEQFGTPKNAVIFFGTAFEAPTPGLIPVQHLAELELEDKLDEQKRISEGEEEAGKDDKNGIVIEYPTVIEDGGAGDSVKEVIEPKLELVLKTPQTDQKKLRKKREKVQKKSPLLKSDFEYMRSFSQSKFHISHHSTSSTQIVSQLCCSKQAIKSDAAESSLRQIKSLSQSALVVCVEILKLFPKNSSLFSNRILQSMTPRIDILLPLVRRRKSSLMAFIKLASLICADRRSNVHVLKRIAHALKVKGGLYDDLFLRQVMDHRLAASMPQFLRLCRVDWQAVLRLVKNVFFRLELRLAGSVILADRLKSLIGVAANNSASSDQSSVRPQSNASSGRFSSAELEAENKLLLRHVAGILSPSSSKDNNLIKLQPQSRAFGIVKIVRYLWDQLYCPFNDFDHDEIGKFFEIVKMNHKQCQNVMRISSMDFVDAKERQAQLAIQPIAKEWEELYEVVSDKAIDANFHHFTTGGYENVIEASRTPLLPEQRRVIDVPESDPESDFDPDADYCEDDEDEDDYYEDDDEAEEDETAKSSVPEAEKKSKKQVTISDTVTPFSPVKYRDEQGGSGDSPAPVVAKKKQFRLSILARKWKPPPARAVKSPDENEEDDFDLPVLY